MPEMDGYTAVENIRQLNNHSSQAVIIALTAHADPGTRKQCLQHTMNDVVTKPIRKKIFLQILQTWIRTLDEDFLFSDEPGKIDEFDEFIDNETTEINSPISIKDGIEDFDNKAEVFFAVLSRFMETLETQIEKIGKKIFEKDFDYIQKEMHKIKGGASNLFAIDLSLYAADIESDLKNGSHKNLDEKFVAFKNEFETLKKFLANKI